MIQTLIIEKREDSMLLLSLNINAMMMMMMMVINMMALKGYLI